MNGTTETNAQAEAREARPAIMDELDQGILEAQREIEADRANGRISRNLWPHEMGYWLEVQEGVARAQALMQQAQALEQEAIGLIGAHNHYRVYLGKAHGLADVDTIQPDGTFVRAAGPEAAPQAVPQIAG